MNDKSNIAAELYDVLGEEGCGVACSEADIFKDENGWQLFLEGFMSPWPLGRTITEARTAIREYAAMGFGLG